MISHVMGDDGVDVADVVAVGKAEALKCFIKTTLMLQRKEMARICRVPLQLIALILTAQQI